jgi:hypothetical protein
MRVVLLLEAGFAGIAIVGVRGLRAGILPSC